MFVHYAHFSVNQTLRGLFWVLYCLTSPLIALTAMVLGQDPGVSYTIWFILYAWMYFSLAAGAFMWWWATSASVLAIAPLSVLVGILPLGCLYALYELESILYLAKTINSKSYSLSLSHSTIHTHSQ